MIFKKLPLSQAQGMFKRQLNREWGHHMARGWASLLHDRLRDFVGGQASGGHELAGEHYFGPDSGTAHVQWAHANNRHHQRTFHNFGGRGV